MISRVGNVELTFIGDRGIEPHAHPTRHVKLRLLGGLGVCLTTSFFEESSGVTSNGLDGDGSHRERGEGHYPGVFKGHLA